MKIELIAKHDNTPITVVCQQTGKKTAYKFEPGVDGRRVAEITHTGHIARLLASPDGWRVYDPDADPNAPVEVAGEDDGSNAPPQGIQTGEPPADGDASKAVADMTEDELREYAKTKYNRTFHHNAKEASIRAEIANLGG